MSVLNEHEICHSIALLTVNDLPVMSQYFPAITITLFSLSDMRKIFPFELFHVGGDEVNTGWWEILSQAISFPLAPSYY